VADAVRGPGNWLLAPGVAIDGYGRELLVTRPIEIAGAPGSVVLYYCEADVGIRPCGPCEDRPAPRIGQYVRLLVKQDFTPLAGDPTDLALARAAGRVPGFPPWPVLLADIDPLKPEVDFRRTRYVRHRADQIWSPARQVILRLGAPAANDFYPFLLWTRPPTPAGDPVKRLGIDRDGTIHVWQPLWISSDVGGANVQGAAGTALQISMPMPAGIGVRVFLKGIMRDPTKPVLEVTWADSLGYRATRERALTNYKNKGLDHAVDFVGQDQVHFRLVKADAPQKPVNPVMTRQKEQQFKQPAFDVEMERRGGTLTLTDFEPVPVSVPTTRGCDDEKDAAAAKPRGPALRLREGTGHQPGVDTREIYTESVPGAAPATELRFAAGSLDESDSHLRLAFGVRADDGAAQPKMTWRPILGIDGAGKVVMPAQSYPFEDTRLDVQGALHLPPIKNDPTDPLVQDLLALAYNAGLRRAGRVNPAGVSAKVTTTTPAAGGTLPQGDTLKYNLTITNTSSVAVIVKHCLEFLVGTDPGNHDVIVRTPPSVTGTVAVPVAPATAATLTIPIELPNFRHQSPSVRLSHELLVSVSDKEWALASTSADFKC
jgi:hypothetical protein